MALLLFVEDDLAVAHVHDGAVEGLQVGVLSGLEDESCVF